MVSLFWSQNGRNCGPRFHQHEQPVIAHHEGKLHLSTSWVTGCLKRSRDQPAGQRPIGDHPRNELELRVRVRSHFPLAQGLFFSKLLRDSSIWGISISSLLHSQPGPPTVTPNPSTDSLLGRGKEVEFLYCDSRILAYDQP